MIVESVIVDQSFFHDSWHHYTSDEFCPQEQEVTAYRALQKHATRKGREHIREKEKEHRVTSPSRKDPHRLLIPVKNMSRDPTLAPRLQRKVKPIHEFEFGNLRHLQLVNDLYQQFMEDTAFCHRWRIIGGTLHPRYPGTLLVLVDAHENFKIPEFYPEIRNYAVSTCPLTGVKVPENKSFLHIHPYYEHEAELLIKSYRNRCEIVPTRYMWLEKLLQLQKTVPTHQEQLSTFGKAFLRLGFAMDRAEFEEAETLDVLKLMIL